MNKIFKGYNVWYTQPNEIKFASSTSDTQVLKHDMPLDVLFYYKYLQFSRRLTCDNDKHREYHLNMENNLGKQCTNI